MTGMVGVLMPQFGYSTGGGGGSDPAIPTLACVDNGNGTATVTVSGSTAGSTNNIYTQRGFPGVNTQSLAGIRTGDGAVTFNLGPGIYYVVCNSVLSGFTSVSLIYYLTMGLPLSSLFHSPANIIRWLLIAAGQLTQPSVRGSWPCFVSAEPDQPDSCVTVYNNGTGLLQGTTNTDNEIQEHYGIQVRVRADDPDTCYTKMRLLTIYMDQNVLVSGVTIGSHSYTVNALTRSGTIMDLGKDVSSSRRNIMTVNYTASIVSLN